MANVENFHSMIKSFLTLEREESENIVAVRITPTKRVFLKKDAINEDNKRWFREAMSSFPRIHEGLSYKDLTHHPHLWLEEHQAIVIQGIGKAFGLWGLFPYDYDFGCNIIGKPLTDTEKENLMKTMFKPDIQNLLPMNTGLK